MKILNFLTELDPLESACISGGGPISDWTCAILDAFEKPYYIRWGGTVGRLW